MGLGGPGDTPPHPKHATSIMINIEKVYEDYLYDCHIANQRLTPEGWAFYGKEEHHIEIPNRDGGVLTPCNSQYLTTYQHWVAGVLQSEVLNKVCLAFVPSGVLPFSLEKLRLKWYKQMGYDVLLSGQGCCTPDFHQQEWVREYKRQTGIKAVLKQTGIHAPGFRESEESIERYRRIGKLLAEQKKGIHALTFEQRSENAKERWRQLSEEERSAFGKLAWINKSAEERSEVAQRSAETVRATYTPEQLLERARRMARVRAPIPIILTTPEGEEIYYELQYDACVEHNLESSKIGAICRGKRKTHKGFTARYADL